MIKQDLSKKLSAYRSSNKGFQHSKKTTNFKTPNRLTQTIVFSVLPSLAHLSLISAQCQGAQATNLVLPSAASNPGLEIDVDGDGVNDFKIFDNGNPPYFAELHMVALNGGAVLTNGGSGTVKNYAANEAINGNNTDQYGGYWWLVYLNPANTQMIGPWGEPYPSSGYIGVKQGGNYGFIELTINSGPVGGNTGLDYNISVAEAGLAPSSSANVMAGDCISLPVELIRFDSEIVKETVVLNWETASEINNAGFEIQKSKDGEKFEHLSFVEGKGNSDLFNSYSFQDTEIRKGQTYYYRLRQFDYDGQFEYSKIITATLNADIQIGELYPNPSNIGEVMLNFNVPESSKTPWTITVFDVTGMQQFTEERTIEKGDTAQRFDLSNLSSGSYFFKIENESTRFFRKVVIAK